MSDELRVIVYGGIFGLAVVAAVYGYLAWREDRRFGDESQRFFDGRDA